MDSVTPSILLAGRCDDIGLQCGGWTLTWQGSAGPTIPGTTLFEGLKHRVGSNRLHYAPDVSSAVFSSNQRFSLGIVCIAESPYAEGVGDQIPVLSAEDVALSQLCRRICDKTILIIYSGRPILIDPILSHFDAICAAFLPGSEAGAGITDVLLGDFNFSAKLSMTWPANSSQLGLQLPSLSTHFDPHNPPLFPFGFGLSF